ncbi:MAG TPA: serine/threonine-protein kinase [Aggregatilineaceae bacterium]|nr:serine/threonine-protein kinase [Aggregatilineaceae bacterium]
MSIFPSLPIDFGPYHVEESLGAGGMATVYRAFDQNRQEWVALKILHPNFAAQPAIVQRFQQEARIAQSLEHAHIVRVIDYGVIDTIPYIALEYISGGSLMDRLQQPTRITLQQAARLLSQVASGLDYAHRQGIIHRDVKPGNVLLDGQGRVALTDFGIARVLDATHLTSTGLMPGTPLFMSPEQARGQRDVDERTDVYALAVMGYLLATGQHPFTGGRSAGNSQPTSDG